MSDLAAHLHVLHKSFGFKAVSTAMLVGVSVASILGGYLTVYASTDCEGTDFKRNSRAFLYTSLTYSLVNSVINIMINTNLYFLVNHPHVAAAVFVAQTLLVAAFLVALVVLLTLVYTSSCGSARQKAEARLGLPTALPAAWHI